MLTVGWVAGFWWRTIQRIGVSEALGGSYSGTLRYSTSNVLYVSFPWRVTFDPSHMLPWAWQEIKGEAVSLA